MSDLINKEKVDDLRKEIDVLLDKWDELFGEIDKMWIVSVVVMACDSRRYRKENSKNE